MTAAIDSTSTLVRDLIRSCEKACECFRIAAEGATAQELKRLFNLYALQRARFAEELRQNVPFMAEDNESGDPAEEWVSPAPFTTDIDLLAHCLEADERLLESYSRMLKQKLPPRQHFFLSAQFSLLQRVHERIGNMLGGATQAASTSTGVTITFRNVG